MKRRQWSSEETQTLWTYFYSGYQRDQVDQLSYPVILQQKQRHL